MIRKLIIIGLLASATPAMAATDAAAVAAATALTQQIGVKARVTSDLNNMVAGMRSGAAIAAQLQNAPGFEQARAAQPAKFNEAFKRIGALQANAAQKVINQHMQTVVDAIIQIYAKTYTVDELKGLTEFYRTPLGASFAAKQPRVDAGSSQAMMQIIGPKLQAAMKPIEPQINAELKKLQGPPPAKK